MNPPKPSQAFEGASRVHADMQDVYGAADASHEPDAPHEPLNRELFAPALLCVKLQGPVDLDGFRRAARSLLARQVPPGQLSWNTGATPGNDLFSTPEAGSQQLAANAAEFSQAPVLKVPPSFVALCKEVVLHSDNGRFDLLYRLLWRLVNEPGLRHDPLDADMAQAAACGLVRARAPYRRGRGAVFCAPLCPNALGHPDPCAQRAVGRCRFIPPGRIKPTERHAAFWAGRAQRTAA